MPLSIELVARLGMTLAHWLAMGPLMSKRARSRIGPCVSKCVRVAFSICSAHQDCLAYVSVAVAKESWRATHWDTGSKFAPSACCSALSTVGRSPACCRSGGAPTRSGACKENVTNAAMRASGRAVTGLVTPSPPTEIGRHDCAQAESGSPVPTRSCTTWRSHCSSWWHGWSPIPKAVARSK